MLSRYYYLKRVETIGCSKLLRKTQQFASSAYNYSMTTENTVRNGEGFSWQAKDSAKHVLLKITDKQHMKQASKNDQLIVKRKVSSSLTVGKECMRLAEALAIAKEESSKGNPLSVFSYQLQKTGFRRFIVAHPEKYWQSYIKIPPTHRHTYEVIPEGSPCWVYLDLEFLTKLNLNKDGPRMTSILIDIICVYMLVHCGIHCNKTNVVNLDSTTDEKFSRHLIFSIKDVAFQNNLHIGSFIKYICADIKQFLEVNTSHEILSYFNKSLLEELFVETGKGKELFIDTSVYNRNRTFRIYKSTKWGKQSSLTVSEDSKHIPVHNCADKELGIFLDSLVSYFPNQKNLIIIKFNNYPIKKSEPANYKQVNLDTGRNLGPCSPYPELDRFVAHVIHPGIINSVFQFDTSLVYGVIGNRYCENIGRWHKSNNVIWVVDLKKHIIYQKCHDTECSGFRSKPIDIPDDIDFYLTTTETNDFLLSCAALTEEFAHLDLSVYSYTS